MMFIVEMGNCLPQGLDASHGAILPRIGGDRDALRSREASWDIIVGFGSTLTKIGPACRIVGKAMFVGALGAPDDACGCAGGVETGVRAVTFVGVTKLEMDAGVLFTGICTA